MPRRAAPAQPKAPPRLMLAQDAADYLNIPLAEVERLAIGRIRLGRSVRYDRVAIDHHIDELAGLTSTSPALSADNDDPEAAFDRSRPDLRHAPRRP
ncbi:MAG: hypothetical protein JF588_19225 [Caulobacterales bacterium]|nr:hypothetical protein [Caulobacterales bacterium]